MTSSKRKHQIDGLLVLLLFSVFAISILSVLLTGADAYKRLADRDDAAYDRRTAEQYVATKVRQAAGEVEVVAFGGVPAIQLAEEIDGEQYITRVYWYDGYIRELFSATEDTLMPEDGEQVFPVEAMTIEQSGNLLRICITDDARMTEQYLLCRGGEGAVS